jgi:hypothetical protein
MRVECGQIWLPRFMMESISGPEKGVDYPSDKYAPRVPACDAALATEATSS